MNFEGTQTVHNTTKSRLLEMLQDKWYDFLVKLQGKLKKREGGRTDIKEDLRGIPSNYNEIGRASCRERV